MIAPRIDDLSDAFDAAEALDMIAHDYGLYAVKTALDDLGFRASPMHNRAEDLEEIAQEMYHDLESEALSSDPYIVPDWAAEIIDRIREIADREDDR